MKDGVPFEKDDYNFYYKEVKISDGEEAELMEYAGHLTDIDNINDAEFAPLHAKFGFSIFHDSINKYRDAVYQNGRFYNERDSAGIKLREPLLAAQRIEVKRCAKNVVDGVGTFQIKGLSEINSIVVVNALGQKVKSINVKGATFTSFEIELKGVYFVQLETTSGELITKKVIVK